MIKLGGNGRLAEAASVDHMCSGIERRKVKYARLVKKSIMSCLTTLQMGAMCCLGHLLVAEGDSDGSIITAH